MNIHVLNGDALAEKFPFAGELIICRECLIEGPVSAQADEQFFLERAKFICDSFEAPVEAYAVKVKRAFDKLVAVPDGSEINLWFEHDLFCQTNLWFVLYLLNQTKSRAIFIVTSDPYGEKVWNGFGGATTSSLQERFQKRFLLTTEELLLGSSLWQAYAANDFLLLKEIADNGFRPFPFLADVVTAHIDRFPHSGFGRPQRRLKEIITNGVQDFPTIFQQFSATEAIYGFGDSQIRNMLARL